MVTDTALDECLANERAVGTNDQLSQFHLPHLHIRVFAETLPLKSIAESRKLCVTTNRLKHIIGEYDIIAIRNVDTTATTKDATDQHTILLTQVQLLQRLPHPQRVGRHLKLCNMDITIQQTAFV